MMLWSTLLQELNMVILGLSGMGDYNPPRDFLAAAGQQFEALLPEFGIQVPPYDQM